MLFFMNVVLSLLACFVLLVDTRSLEQIFKVPNNYPRFEQCDSKWGNDETKTICDVGCILTSTSMALNYYHISIDGQSANPGTLNKWLKANNGYTSSNDFIENRLEKLSPLIKYRGQKEHLNDSEIIDNLNNGIVTIAHVRNGTHFVLMTGYSMKLSKEWLVNDPFFNQTVYTNSEIVDYRIFTMKN